MLRAFNSPEEAILYSVDSISTHGGPGLMLEHHWRMMGALEATDGMLLFGISTAYIVTVMQAYWALMIPPSLSEDLVLLRADGVTAGQLAHVKNIYGLADALG
jgi:hypothetical protein